MHTNAMSSRLDAFRNSRWCNICLFFKSRAGWVGRQGMVVSDHHLASKTIAERRPPAGERLDLTQFERDGRLGYKQGA